ncbi:MAG TPA: ATP-binding protein, partial [Povalibacter sp.]
RNALSEVREAITGYRAGDLLSELDRAQSTLETAGVAVERICDSVDMDPAQERVLALVLREAVTNVVRHSQAKRCRLTLQRTEQAHRMAISDDGCGGAHREGMGMRGIRERVAALGGEVSWSVGMGTELIVTVPLDASMGEPA